MPSVLNNPPRIPAGPRSHPSNRETIAATELERLSYEYAITRDPELREVLILHHQRLVRSIVARFSGSEEPIEDLVQVGTIGLINALDRYDPSQGTRFSTYATPTILGEIRRYFRDKAVGIKIPRWLQELQQAIRRTINELTLSLGRAPSPQEVALHLEVCEEHILLAMESQEAGNLLSLDTCLEGSSNAESPSMQELIGQPDRLLNDFERYGDLRGALNALGDREREVISMRFYDELSQAKIAQRLNISQMHVSRLQQRALRHLKDLLSDEPVIPTPRRRTRRSA